MIVLGFISVVKGGLEFCLNEEERVQVLFACKKGVSKSLEMPDLNSLV